PGGSAVSTCAGWRRSPAGDSGSSPAGGGVSAGAWGSGRRTGPPRTGTIRDSRPRSPPAGDDQAAWPSDDGLVTDHRATESHGRSQDERAELERLRAETAELRSQQAGKNRRRRFSWRTPVSIVLIVLGCVLGPVAVLGVWAGNEVSDTGRWVA